MREYRCVCLKCETKITSRMNISHSIKVFWHIQKCRPSLLDMTVRTWCHTNGRDMVIATPDELDKDIDDG